MHAKHARFIRLIGLVVLVMSIAVGTAQATTPLGLKADGLRLQAMADRYGWLQGVKAEGLRWQAAAQYYATHKPTAAATTSDSFNWGDAGIGAASGLGLAVAAVAAVGFARHSRRAKLAL